MDGSFESLGSSLPDLTPRDATCDTHGPYQSRNIIGKVWSRCPECERIRSEKLAAEKADEDRRHREARARKLLGRAAIPERFVGRGFDSFTADTDDKRRALTVLRDYSERFDEYARKGQGLILFGLPGTGKSHLAGAVLQAHIDRDVLYATCLDLIRMVRETWRKDAERSERQVLASLVALDLLVIDEMGVQYGTDGEQTILFDVLDGRYREMRPTILLTNQDSEGLKGYLGERTFDRLRETCRFVPFQWASFRPMARKVVL
jgi:DNA replication protein DnaC